MGAALDYMARVLYPNLQDSVATPAALPLVGNTLNDFRTVLDDGDGKPAGYRWEQREGDVSPSWYKIYDRDWGDTLILSDFLNQTQDVYVVRNGRSDKDAAGADITGVYAGQNIFGGDKAGQNLTLSANSGDGTGADTGFVQFDDQIRPTANNIIDLGTATSEFKDLHLAGTANVGDLVLSAGSITDSSGNISFGDENLSTTGNIDGGVITAATNFITGTLTLDSGSITDSSGSISFGDENLSTAGTLASGTHTISTLVLAAGSITDTSGSISFGDENLSTTGTLNAGATNVSQLDVDNLRLDGNSLISTNTNGNIIFTADGTGIVDVQSPLQTLGQTITGTVGITGQLNIDDLRLDGSVISGTGANTDITLQPSGTGDVIASAVIRPNADNTLSLGEALQRFTTLHLSTGISDGTLTITMATLLSLRDILAGVNTGDALFWDGTKFVASNPDTEIIHAEIGGLGADDHAQYALLAGRATGQTLTGGTAASENLTLESTANATKGLIQFSSNLVPTSDATFSGGWSGTDIGQGSQRINDLYSAGEFIGFRIQNFLDAGLPSASAQSVGRLAYATDTELVYVDTGTSLKVVGANKHLTDEAFDGVQTTKTITVSNIQDARRAFWRLLNNASDFKQIMVDITAISATQVTVTTTVPLPAGTYRLIGIE